MTTNRNDLKTRLAALAMGGALLGLTTGCAGTGDAEKAAVDHADQAASAMDGAHNMDGDGCPGGDDGCPGADGDGCPGADDGCPGADSADGDGCSSAD